MKWYEKIFNNIEKFYKENNEDLIVNDGLRPSKSIPRDIFASVDKFKDYYNANKVLKITKPIVLQEILGVADKDTFNTNIRLMKELNFIETVSSEEWNFTGVFINFVDSELNIESYYLNKLKNIRSVNDLNMTYNSSLCVLREGYIHGVIYDYPDSEAKFISAIPNKEERIQHCLRVKSLYGFEGRGKKAENGDFTPNANYRIITPLKKLNLIEKTKDGLINEFELTNEGYEFLELINDNLDDTIQIEEKNSLSIVDKPHNRIVFGAPGTGKSYRLEKDREVFGDNYERVTFHPNYSYSNFVGTYKPTPKNVNDNKELITYEYIPGPFMRVLTKAIKNKESQFLLLIEEINRANVSAVFGEVFQLLDRTNGQSTYEIETSEDMRKYFVKEIVGGIEKDYEKIIIPSNMYIWATMNSADQGVFPMDTAFKRRWDFEYIDIDENEKEIEDIVVCLGKDEHEVKWNDLRKAINEILLDKCKVNEDKLLGPFFISNSVLEYDSETMIVKNNKKFLDVFKSKVIMYIFEDAAGRQHRRTVFTDFDKYNTYSKICKRFDEIGEAIFGLDLRLNKEDSNDEQ